MELDTRPDEAESIDTSADFSPEDGDGANFEAEDVTVRYPGTDAPVIEGESLIAPPGQVTALVGPNGSGKSTFLKALSDELSPEEGAVYLDGGDIQQLSTKEQARKLGLLSQENAAPDSITVEKLVEHGRYPHRGFFDGLTEEDTAAVDEAIEMAGVDHLRDRNLSSLSGGQKQLVWIAMVLAQETDVLLLDEPTTFLDLHHQLEVMEIVETLRDRDMTVVVVLHDLQQAARHADYMVAMRDGKVIDWGPSADVVTEELLAEVFRIEADITQGPHGPEITPLRPRHE